MKSVTRQEGSETAMGIKNYLVEGVSGTGKTSVADELHRRGYHVIHGDRELKYWGDPITGASLVEPLHESETDKVVWRHGHLLWDIDKVRSATQDQSVSATFFCGGSRNFSSFIDLFDLVFVLDVSDLRLLYQRLDRRVALDPTEFGGTPEAKELLARLHATKADIPHRGIVIDATAPIASVVDKVLLECQSPERALPRRHRGFGEQRSIASTRERSAGSCDGRHSDK